MRTNATCSRCYGAEHRCAEHSGLLLDVDQKVGIVPELGSTSVGVKRFGPEIERRTLCNRQFEEFYESSIALAIADKNNPPGVARSKGSTVPGLAIDGRARGSDCTCFASLTSPSTIALVERLENEWSVLALTVNPTERYIGTIVAAELAMLTKLRARAVGASLMVLTKANDTLAGDSQRLGLTPLLANEVANVDADKLIWFRCEA